jgi:ferredoxin
MGKVNPNLMTEIKDLGAFDVSACYSCGTCTAVCPLSETGHEFPRKIIRYAMVGDEKRLVASTEPWLCYFCGECTTSCPRGADPASFMMATRRYLTTKYDFTGFSKKYYHSKIVEIAAAVILFSITVLLVALLHANVPMPMFGSVELNTFAGGIVWTIPIINHPVDIVELGDLSLLAILSILLLINLFRMFKYTVLDEVKGKIPIKVYFVQLKELIVHLLTQKRITECKEEGTNWDWITHILVFYGYASIFVLVIILFDYFQADTPYWWMTVIGTIAAVALLIGTSYMLYGRLTKNGTWRTYTHASDWYFLGLLWLVVVTGIFVVIFEYLSMPMATYVTYAIHLGVIAAFETVVVPFGKWSHIAYRPFGIYFTKIKDAVNKAETNQ